MECYRNARYSIWWVMKTTINTRNSTNVFAVKFLSHADIIIALGEDGTVMETGTYQTLLSSGGYVASLAKPSLGIASDEAQAVNNGATEEREPPHLVSPTTQTPDQDKRRQLGDKSVYKYYFGSVGFQFTLILLFLEVVWTFLQSFPGKWKQLVFIL